MGAALLLDEDNEVVELDEDNEVVELDWTSLEVVLLSITEDEVVVAEVDIMVAVELEDDEVIVLEPLVEVDNEESTSEEDVDDETERLE